MKKSVIFTLASFIIISLASFTAATKLGSNKTHIKFFSSTPAEDIESNNYKAVSTIDPGSGEIVFSVPMQSFEFDKALMQKHFNNKEFLDTKSHPKAKLTGKITNLDDVNFSKDGTYNVEIKGDLTIKGSTKPFHEKGTINVKGQKVEANSKFTVTLADYGVAFEKGKPATNVAKSVEVTVFAEYQLQ
ncbi:hypothetical protein BH23BAC2_BH23BAC2_00440 [soil metagenome]